MNRRDLQRAALATGYFFFLLAAYYVLRPLRDEMGVLFGGAPRLHLLFTGTFLATLLTAPLFAWLVSRYPRHVFLPGVIVASLLCLLGFWYLTRAGGWVGAIVPAFFIFLSVFNLFVVSVFWSFLAEVFSREEAARLGVDFLGEIPLHLSIREGSDDGAPVVAANPDGAEARAFLAVAEKVAAQLEAGVASKPPPRIVMI